MGYRYFNSNPIKNITGENDPDCWFESEKWNADIKNKLIEI